MKNQAFYQNFYKQVLLKLREMLQTFKQSDTPATRKQFEGHCQELLNMGKKANLTAWVQLLTVAKAAISNPKNPYHPCGRIIIKEVQEAGKLIAQGNTENFTASKQLQALATPPIKKTVSRETTWEELDSIWQQEEDENTIYTRDPWETEKVAKTELEILPTTKDVVATEEIQDLFDDFYNNDLEIGQVDAIEEIKETEETEELEGIIRLFELNNLKKSPNIPQKSPETVYFYQQFSQLEQLLDQPPIKTTPAIFAELETLLKASPTFIDSVEPELTTFRTLPSPVKATLSGTAKANHLEQTMRVPIKQLDNLNNLIGELVIKRNRLEEDQERLRQFLDNLLKQVKKLSDVNERIQYLQEKTILERAILAGRSQQRNPLINYLPQGEPMGRDTPEMKLNAFEMDKFNEFDPLAQEIIELIVRTRESTSDIQYLVDETNQVARSLRQVTTSLQEELNNARMVTFSTNADRMLRGVREISLKLKKSVEVVVEGREVLVDKMILDQLYNPLTHLVNNTITHGIELPEVRKARGKRPTGEIRIKAFIQGNQTIISVADDGAGIDTAEVKEKAISKGLITKEKAENMVNQEVYELLFHAGFTTKDKADDFSGRGVGLDVVRTSLQPIRGTVSIDSTLGKGTSFTIRLPLTLTICKALPCLSNNARIAFPIDGVEDTKDYRPEDIKINDQGQKCIVWSNQLLPYQPLNSLLSYKNQAFRSSIDSRLEYDDTISIIILRSAGSLLAIQVDKIFPEQEIVIKQITGPIPKPAGIAGATVLGDGRIMPIGDVMELIEIAQGRRSIDYNPVSDTTYNPQVPKLPRTSEPIVLIVDDSITVRQLLSLTFNKVGYRIEEARDGQEAWEKLSSGLLCDLVFCDIEMPRMNGLKLLSTMQQDPKLRDIPVALLTSRGAQKHRQIAAELGASGYLTKPCTDKELLDSAQRMIAGEKLIDQKANASGSSSTQPVQKGEMTALIVDDSVVVREMLSLTFKKSGYRVEQARDGQEAWEKLRSGLPCNIIFCDVEMPRMSGLELLSHLREDNELSSIPVAIITSRGAEKHRKIAAELGAKAYFTKPYLEEELLDAAKRIIQGEVFLKESETV